MQGVRSLRNEAYLWYVAMTKDEAQRRRWTFYEAVNHDPPQADLHAVDHENNHTRLRNLCALFEAGQLLGLD